MPSRVSPDDVVSAVRRVADARRGQTVFIGIDGYGGAGKSTLAGRIGAGVPDSVVVHVDDFAAPDLPEWDWDRFREQLLLPLLADRPARYQRWDWARDEGAEWHDVPVGRVVIVEGVSSTRHEVGAPWALTVWVDAPLKVRLARAVERDGAAMLPMWLDAWVPSEDAYVAREDPLARVDLIVSGVTDAIIVRPAKFDDLAALERDVPSRAVGVWDSHFARQQDGSCVFLVAFVGTRPVGTGLLDWQGSRATNASARYPGLPTVSNLHVDPPVQGHGVGTALIRVAERIAGEHGRGGITISVGLDNPDAARLYLRLGYQRTAVVDESRYTWVDRDGVTHAEVEQDELLVKLLVVGGR